MLNNKKFMIDVKCIMFMIVYDWYKLCYIYRWFKLIKYYIVFYIKIFECFIVLIKLFD